MELAKFSDGYYKSIPPEAIMDAVRSMYVADTPVPYSPVEFAAIHSYLDELIQYGASEIGRIMIENEAPNVVKIDHLKPHQVRGFRSEIVKYRVQPKESARILRVLRRLHNRQVSRNVLFDSGIEAAVRLLISHEANAVKTAAIRLLKKWQSEHPGTARLASFMQNNKADAASNANQGLRLLSSKRKHSRKRYGYTK